MNDSAKNWPGIFGGLRVPFDPKVILIGLIGLLVFLGGIEVIEFLFEKDDLILRTLSHPCLEKCKFLGKMTACKTSCKAPCTLEMVILIIWTVFTWAMFGGTINRMVAIRIAKDDTMEIKEAFRFLGCIRVVFFPFFQIINIWHGFSSFF